MAYYNIMKAARGWAVCIVGGGYAVNKVTVSRSSLTPFDRIAPTGNCGTPRTGNASEDWQRLRWCRLWDLLPFLRVLFRCCLIWTISTARPLTTCFSSPRGETVIIRLPALSAHHRLALPGLFSSIFFQCIIVFPDKSCHIMLPLPQ